MEINELKDIASQVRRDIIRMVHACQSGHPGGSLGATDIVTALYFDQMRIKPQGFSMDGAGEDMFFLSNGHISPMLYSITGDTFLSRSLRRSGGLGRVCRVILRRRKVCRG